MISKDRPASAAQISSTSGAILPDSFITGTRIEISIPDAGLVFADLAVMKKNSEERWHLRLFTH
jgi:hypothetical protein